LDYRAQLERSNRELYKAHECSNFCQLGRVYKSDEGRQQIMNNLFDGREMVCLKCGWKFKSRPGLESMWTTVSVDNRLFDICPFCWGVPKHLIPKEVKAERMHWKDEN